ncbi:MAG: hypothetical protein E4H01_07575, partial [Lysobacterales bacterium]
MNPIAHTRGAGRMARLGLMIALLCFMLPAGAQPPAANGEAPAAPTLDEIQVKRKAAEQNSDLPQDIQAKALELYDRAIEAVNQSAEVAAMTGALITRIEEGPARVAELRAQLSRPRPPVESTAATVDMSAEELQAAVNVKRAKYSVARDTLDEKEATLASLTQSGKSIVEEYASRERSLAKITEEARTPPSPDTPPAVAEARNFYLAARRSFEQAELSRLRRRNASYDLLVELTTLERDLVAADIVQIQAERTALEEVLQEQRERSARAGRLEAEAAIAASAALPSPVAAIAEQTSALQKELVSIIEREKNVNEALRDVTRRYREIQDKFQSMRERIANYGASQALGRLLQRRLEKLPSSRELRGFSRKRRNEISRVTDRRIEVEDLQQQFVNTTAEVESILSSIEPAPEPAKLEALRSQTTELVQAQRDTLAELDKAYARYLTRLTALEAADREVAKMAQEFSVFIRKELTWIPNLPPLAPSDFIGLPKALGWLFSPSNWRQTLSGAGRSFASNPLYSVAALLAIVLTVIGRWQARHRLAP